MTVFELIAELNKYDPNTEIFIKRRFQFHDYYNPYISDHITARSDGGIIIYEDTDGS